MVDEFYVDFIFRFILIQIRNHLIEMGNEEIWINFPAVMLMMLANKMLNRGIIYASDFHKRFLIHKISSTTLPYWRAMYTVP